MSGYMYGKSVEEVRRQKEQNARNRIALEKSRAAAALAKRKQQESGLIYVPPAPRALAVAPVPFAVAPIPAPAPAPRPLAPVPASTSAQIQAAFDRGVSHAALIFLTDALNELIDASTRHAERFVEARENLVHGGEFARIEMVDRSIAVANEKEKISKVYFSVKKAIDTLLQKKERAPGNKRWNNAHNRMSNNVKDLIHQVQQSAYNLRNTDVRDRVQQSLDNASLILNLRGNEAEVKKEFNETLHRIQAAEEAVRDAPAKEKEAAKAAAKALWDATHKRMEEARARVEQRFALSDASITGGKRTRRNRKHKNKKSRKYTRRN